MTKRPNTLVPVFMCVNCFSMHCISGNMIKDNLEVIIKDHGLILMNKRVTSEHQSVY